MRQYVSLHNHTIGSIGDSLITPKQLIEATQEAGQRAVAVTDHGSMSRLWETYKAAKKAGIKLIAGCEIYFVEDASNENDTTLTHLVLLAKNQKGYQNLLTLNKKGFDQQNVIGKRAISRVDWKLLEQYHEGLICTSACGNGIVAQCVMRDDFARAERTALHLQQIFGDDFTLELQPHNLQRRASAYSGAVNQQKVNLALKKLSEKLGIRCIVATDAHYIRQAHHKAHDVYLCDTSGQPITSGNRLRYDKPDFYVKNAEEVYEHFTRHMKVWGEEFVESLFENTIYYADQCEDAAWISPEVMTGEKSQLPEFPYKDEPDYEQFKAWQAEDSGFDFKQFKKSDIPEDAQFYRFRTQEGLVKKINQDKIPASDLPECIQQSLEEFDVFEYRGFSSYMLITADVLKWARDNNILVSAGRGSCGGSLTAYVNNIHQAYPKRYGLIFARFLNKYKEAYPDVDMDLAPSGREKIIDYLRRKYGPDNIAHVSNINTITPKVYARDIARVFEFDGSRSAAAEKGNLIADSIPTEMHTVKQALEEAPLFAEYAKQYPELAEFAELLCGLPRAWSTHAGGVIISKRPLEGLVPLRRDNTGVLVLEYDKIIAEENGLIKYDFLGLETLDIINETYKLIKDSGKEIIDFDYEIYDKKTYDLISDGDTFGVFQLGSTAVNVCKKVKPKNIDDIALISALVRPSSKDSIPAVLDVRNENKKVSLPHKDLERSFGNTYGIGLYEESLLFLAGDFSGWDLNEADKLRKLTKEKGKNPEKVKQWKEEFIESAYKRGHSKEFADEVWGKYVESFQGYGFNKSVTEDELVNIFTLEGKFIISKPIKDIQPGEFVRSRNEETGEDIYIEVIRNHDHGELEVVEVELETGEKVKCTMNHKFRVQETGEMLPLWKIIELGYSMVVSENISITDEDWVETVVNKDEELAQIKNQIVAGLGLSQDQIGEHPLHIYELKQKIENYDLLVTTIRNILTKAGIPDREDYPDENVDEYEKSLRAAGRVIALDQRVKLACDNTFSAKRMARKDPEIIKQFLEDLAWELEEVYKNSETGLAPTFINKAVYEISTIKEFV